MWEIPPLEELKDAVSTPACPIGKRMRAAYFLRQLYDDDKKKGQLEDCGDDGLQKVVITTLGKGLKDKRHGSLLRHEFAYVMGQLRDKGCCKTLGEVLLDDTDCVMVRHECAEALGAIGPRESTIALLEEARGRFSHVAEIGETCEIALAHLYWQQRQNTNGNDKENDDDDDDGDDDAALPPPAACACMISPYSSVDPAPPHPSHVHLSTSELGAILLCNDSSTTPASSSSLLFARYQAMFSLRNRGGSEAVLELGRALVTDTTSALFRHEVAYVLGQMQHEAAVDALAECLRRRRREHAMVRHEAAEALGAMEGGERWDECHALLQEFLHDDDVVVAESCAVALDAADYFGQTAAAEEESDEKEAKEDHAVSSFGGHKAQSNGRRQPSEETKQVLRNHFNIASK